MPNNPEMAFLASARRLGQLQVEGFDVSSEQEITHSFYTSGEDVALRKALREQGFLVSDREDASGLEARRVDSLSSDSLKRLTGQLCSTADKYAAQYDGWDLAARLDRSAQDR